MKTISYKSIIEKLNLEALRYAPDGNIFTGYEILKNKKILLEKHKSLEIYIIPTLKEGLQISIEIVSNKESKVIENISPDSKIDI